MVPEGWEEHALGDLVSSQNIGTSERGSEESTSVPLIKMGNLLWGGLDLRKLEEINGSKLSENQYLRRGDVLFNTRNTPELVGKTALWNGELPLASYDNNIARLRFKKNVDPHFISAFMAHGPGKRRIRSRAAGSTSVAAIYWKDLARLKLSFPPLPEQRKIADILSTWDAAIEKTEALLATARAQKRALMQSLLTGKRRFPEFEGQPWKEVRLGDICDPKQWTTISAKNMTETGFPVYGANGHIGWFSEFNHQQETIAVGCRGVCGSVHLVPPKSYITGNSMALDDVRTDKAVVRFLFQYLTYFGFRDIVSGSAQPQITGKAIKAYKLTIPSVEEQQMIADVFDVADCEIRTIIVKVAKLHTEKKALMQQLLTGKRRVVV